MLGAVPGGSDARGRVVREARRHRRADARVASRALVIRLPPVAGRDQRQHAARREPGDPDLVRVDVERRGVGPRPPDARLCVLDLGRPLGLVREPVLGGDARIADGGVVPDAGHDGVLASSGEPPAVEEHQGHPVPDARRRTVHVASELATAARPVHPVLLDRRGALFSSAHARPHSCNLVVQSGPCMLRYHARRRRSGRSVAGRPIQQRGGSTWRSRP